MTPPTFKSTS